LTPLALTPAFDFRFAPLRNLAFRTPSEDALLVFVLPTLLTRVRPEPTGRDRQPRSERRLPGSLVVDAQRVGRRHRRITQVIQGRCRAALPLPNQFVLPIVGIVLHHELTALGDQTAVGRLLRIDTPVSSSQESIVHGFSSSHCGGRLPTQLPADALIHRRARDAVVARGGVVRVSARPERVALIVRAHVAVVRAGRAGQVRAVVGGLVARVVAFRASSHMDHRCPRRSRPNRCRSPCRTDHRCTPSRPCRQPCSRRQSSLHDSEQFASPSGPEHGSPVLTEQVPPEHVSVPLQNRPSSHAEPSVSAAVQSSVASLHDSEQSPSPSGP
jgi:hypothetical protein